MTATSVAAKVRMYIRYASVDKIDTNFVRDLIYCGRHKEVFNLLVEIGFRAWDRLEYLPGPVPDKSLRGGMINLGTKISLHKVIPIMPLDPVM